MLADAVAALHLAAAMAGHDAHRAAYAASWASQLTRNPPADESHVARLTGFCAGLRGI